MFVAGIFKVDEDFTQIRGCSFLNLLGLKQFLNIFVAINECFINEMKN